jgi:hypothetical protein
VMAREIHSIHKKTRGDAIIASRFPAPDVIAHTRVTLFGR